MEALDKLQKLADALLLKRDASQSERDSTFRLFLQEEDYKSALSSSSQVRSVIGKALAGLR